jgi:hypothetical protein
MGVTYPIGVVGVTCHAWIGVVGVTCHAWIGVMGVTLTR